MSPRTRCNASLLGACLALAACASPLPRVVTIAPGERTRVQVIDLGANGHTFTVQNASSTDREKVYRDTAGESGLKLVADDRLQQLLDVLAAQGMFAKAGAAPMAGSRAAIVVEQGSRRMVWSRPLATPENVELIRVFEESRAYVLSVYNAASAYRATELDQIDPKLRAKIEAEKQKTEQARIKAAEAKAADAKNAAPKTSGTTQAKEPGK